MDRRLGAPLPHQLANPTRADPLPINLSPEGRIRYYTQFPRAIPYRRARSHALLTRLPLPASRALDLHVLSLPPAFVLSQNQTLRLRFDSDALGIQSSTGLCTVSRQTRHTIVVEKRFSVSVSQWWSDPPQNTAACVSLSNPTMSKSRTSKAIAFSVRTALASCEAAAARRALSSARPISSQPSFFSISSALRNRLICRPNRPGT